jgi:hypothetical protein
VRVHAGTPALRNPDLQNRELHMSKILRGAAAGYGAKKLGGGCLSTVLVFIVLWWLLGNFEIFG